VSLPVVGLEEEGIVGRHQWNSESARRRLEIATPPPGGGGVADQLTVQARAVRPSRQHLEYTRVRGQQKQVRPRFGEHGVEGKSIGLHVALGDDLTQVGVPFSIPRQEHRMLALCRAGGALYVTALYVAAAACST
jgi:non-ribosomal peptide synthetase component F